MPLQIIMKKILSIVLALSLLVSASAITTFTINAAMENERDSLELLSANSNIAVGSTVDGGTWTVENGNFTLSIARARNHDRFNSYILGESTNSIQLSASFEVGRNQINSQFGDVGFLVGVSDENGDGAISEIGDKYYLVEVDWSGKIGISRNDGEWREWDEAGGLRETEFSTGDMVTLTVDYADGVFRVSMKGKDKSQSGFEFTWTDPRPFSGSAYAIASKQGSGSVISNVTVNGKIFEGPSDPVKYKLFDIGMSWSEAATYCEKLDGHLVTITSYEEQVIVESLLSEGNRNSYWIGGVRSGEGFNWITEESFDYSNWASGEPNDNQQSGGENVLMIYNASNPMSWSSPGQWNDLCEDGTCGTEGFFGLKNFGFICEWEWVEDNPIEEPEGAFASKYGWCLTNNRESFGYDENYRIDMGKYYSVYGISLSTLLGSSLKSIPKWNGNCFGLTLLSLAQYYNIIDIRSYFNNNGEYLYEFGFDNIYTDSNGEQCFSVQGNVEAIDLIERALISQDAIELSKCEILKNDSHFNNLIDYLSSSRARPIMVTFQSGISGHAMVLTTDIKPTQLNDDSDWYAIPAYDSNAPSKSDLLTNPMSYYLRGNSWLLVNPETSEWRYYVNEKVQMSNKYHSFSSWNAFGNLNGQSIWFYDVSLLDSSFFTETLNLFHKHIQIKFGCSTIRIKNSNNEVLLNMVDGEIIEIDEKSTCIISVNGVNNESPCYTFYTDDTDLKINANDAEIVGINENYFFLIRADKSYYVDMNFSLGKITAYCINTNNDLLIGAQEIATDRCLKATGVVTKDENISLAFSDDILKDIAMLTNANISFETEGIQLDEYVSHEHYYDSSTWMSNEAYHWHECSVCGDVTDKVEHIFTDKSIQCDVCGYIKNTAGDLNSDSVAETDDVSLSSGSDEQTQNIEMSVGQIELLAAGVVILAASVTVCVLFALRRKKRKSR